MVEPQFSETDKTIVAETPTLASPDPRFKMLKCLGSGGMGDVHLAEDSALRRMVAIKTIRADLCKNEEIRKRIERECLLHAKIGSHPHIVTLFDRLEHGGQINLVMEFVEGETLQDLLTKNASSGQRLSWKDGINIAVQTLEALGRIHAHGIVHRDIKPSNIIVTRDDSGAFCAKLMDFGIARMQIDDEQSTMLTKDGTGGPGTPTYMAPEQIDPKTFGPISSATDVYAMGVMLYQILSGRPPFVGSLTEVFNGHLNRQPPVIDFHGDTTIPPAITEILECALAKKPSQRFPSVKVFREELLRAAQGTLTAGQMGTGGLSDDTNRTMVASSVSGAGYAPAEHGATMLDTTSGKRGGRSSAGKIIAIIAVLMVAAAAVAAWFVFSGSGKTDEPKETTPAEAEPAPDAKTPATTEPATAPTPVPAAETPQAPQDTTPQTSAPDAAAPTVPPQTPAPDAAAPPVPPQTPASTPAAQPAQAIPPAIPAPMPQAPPSPTPADRAPAGSGKSAMDAFLENRKPSEPSAPEPPAPTVQPPAPAEPPAAKTEPPKPKATTKPKVQETVPPPAKPETKPEEPAKPAEPTSGSGGWKVIENTDRKVN